MMVLQPSVKISFSHTHTVEYYTMNWLRPCAFKIHLLYSLAKVRGVVLTFTLYFILYLLYFI